MHRNMIIAHKNHATNRKMGMSNILLLISLSPILAKTKLGNNKRMVMRELHFLTAERIDIYDD